MLTERHQKDDPEGKMMSNDRKTASLTERTEEKPSSSQSRPREGCQFSAFLFSLCARINIYKKRNSFMRRQ